MKERSDSPDEAKKSPYVANVLKNSRLYVLQSDYCHAGQSLGGI
jgi:hypothetical protein